MPDEWRTLLRLTGIVAGQGPDADVDALDEMVAGEVARRAGIPVETAAPRVGPERLLDLLLRAGPYDLTLDALAPAPLVDDVARLRAALDAPADGMVLVGRRHLRSNNSWMHNLPLLVRGPERCTLHLHPDDAERLGIGDGEQACV